MQGSCPRPPGHRNRYIDKLEEAGLVARESVQRDRRGVAITLTPRGVEKLQEARAIFDRGIRDNFMRFPTEEEIESFLSTLEKILSAAEIRPFLADKCP